MSLTEEVTFGKEGEIEDTGLLRKLFLSLVILLVASLSFGLGRLTGEEREGIKLEFDPLISNSQFPISNQASVSSAITNIENSASVIASKNGTKYHYLHCSGAKRILEANRIVFATKEAAEASGYTLAANCKPK